MGNQGRAAQRRRWADKYIPECQQILAALFNITPEQVRIATKQEDYCEATDLVLPNGETIAVKTRKYDIFKRYPFDFAFRFCAPPPYESEFVKVKSGRGRYMLYTFASEDESQLFRWVLIDLNVFRTAAASWFCDVTSYPAIKEADKSLKAFCWRDWPAQRYGKIMIARGLRREGTSCSASVPML